jgi:starch phosphorylase
MNQKTKIETCLSSELKSLPCNSQAIGKGFERYLTYHLGRFQTSNPFYFYEALSMTLRDRVVVDWCKTWEEHRKPGVRRAYYLSLEFLMGRALGNNMLNMGLTDNTREAMHECCLALEDIEEVEPDAGLGNGGLGRLAACFMDSCASLQLPVLGYGIRYEYGMFRQKIVSGYQQEEPDHWLRDGNPWELERPEYTQRVKFGGHTEFYRDEHNIERARWVDTHDVLAIPFDVPITGYKNNTVNTLRLWKSFATDEFDLEEFNAGSYTEAVASKNSAEHITMVLYPNDASENGKELRLRQQYFLASASLQDVFRQWEKSDSLSYQNFVSQNVFQMNDTHPTISVAEMMRILMDKKCLDWDEAWEITSKTMAYTNHTLLPEALEKWPIYLFEQLLPRVLEIIYEINARFMRLVQQKWPGEIARHHRMSIIEEGPYRQVRMANLAIVGSFSVNGVAALHSQLLCEGLFHDFYELWPEKFSNKTNGVTPRRWIAYANPEMTSLINRSIGDDWITDLSHISKLKKFANAKNHEFQADFKKVKQSNKQRLAYLVEKLCGVKFNTDSLFDIQVKRIHEYKRQLLNVLHVIYLYNQIKLGNTENWTNRCVLIGGKAAPGYALAKSIIKLINNVAEVINSDADVGDKLKLVFFPNYGVTAMEVIAPAADLSEQISTAGKEASGTGNMKFMMNGALTIGTYDGANIEILKEVGEENFFLFGLHADEVQALRGHYDPMSYINQDKDLKAVMELLQCGHFNAFEPGVFDNVIQSLYNPHDPWVTLADFRSYIDAQNAVSEAWHDQEKWGRMSIMNTASSGFFSTDRTMQDYNRDIWKLEPVVIKGNSNN